MNEQTKLEAEMLMSVDASRVCGREVLVDLEVENTDGIRFGLLRSQDAGRWLRWRNCPVGRVM